MNCVNMLLIRDHEDGSDLIALAIKEVQK